eukprot:TRINITY_DN4081_c0_g1_i1.p1 TRINITY_DN4081_c0_g1~~TRINITY_DN4081_c0_g1_i1.p1  ORF type:complete len:254 (+),score=37.15 TRINITY_DN4081_c0_g1_i1:22-762(+)
MTPNQRKRKLPPEFQKDHSNGSKKNKTSFLSPELLATPHYTDLALRIFNSNLFRITSTVLARAKTEAKANFTESPHKSTSLDTLLKNGLFAKSAQKNPVLPIIQKKKVASRAGTRGFRAPEVLLRYTGQTTAIDIWSAGTILLSLLSTRYPFMQSHCDLTAIAEICALCGTDEVKEVATILGRKLTISFHHTKVKWKDVLLKLRGTEYHLNLTNDSVFDLLDRCLEPNPFLRITAKQALKHPFLSQ